MNLLGKDLKEGNFVHEGFKNGARAQEIGELDPLIPCSAGASCASRRDALEHGFLSSVEITAKMVHRGGVQT